MLLPEAKLAADNTGADMVKLIITDCSPVSVVLNLQTTFTPCGTADKSHVYNRYEQYTSSCLINSQYRNIHCIYGIRSYSACIIQP